HRGLHQRYVAARDGVFDIGVVVLHRIITTVQQGGRTALGDGDAVVVGCRQAVTDDRHCHGGRSAVGRAVIGGVGEVVGRRTAIAGGRVRRVAEDAVRIQHHRVVGRLHQVGGRQGVTIDVGVAIQYAGRRHIERGVDVGDVGVVV